MALKEESLAAMAPVKGVKGVPTVPVIAATGGVVARPRVQGSEARLVLATARRPEFGPVAELAAPRFPSLEEATATVAANIGSVLTRTATVALAVTVIAKTVSLQFAAGIGAAAAVAAACPVRASSAIPVAG